MVATLCLVMLKCNQWLVDKNFNVIHLHHIIGEFAKLAYLLHSLTKKGVDFYWSVDCQRALEKLKDKLLFVHIMFWRGQRVCTRN